MGLHNSPDDTPINHGRFEGVLLVMAEGLALSVCASSSCHGLKAVGRWFSGDRCRVAGAGPLSLGRCGVQAVVGRLVREGQMALTHGKGEPALARVDGRKVAAFCSRGRFATGGGARRASNRAILDGLGGHGGHGKPWAPVLSSSWLSGRFLTAGESNLATRARSGPAHSIVRRSGWIE